MAVIQFRFPDQPKEPASKKKSDTDIYVEAVWSFHNDSLDAARNFLINSDLKAFAALSLQEKNFLIAKRALQMLEEAATQMRKTVQKRTPLLLEHDEDI